MYGDFSLQKGNIRMPRKTPRKAMTRSKYKSVFRNATSAVKRLFTRGLSALEQPEPSVVVPQEPRKKSQPKAARVARRETDIPLDVLSGAYTPPMTSSKASFRSDGSDHQLDQEFAYGQDWKDEDQYTNKSGDPRIGTHRRTYEPEEARAEE